MDLDELERLLREATAGPWRNDNGLRVYAEDPEEGDVLLVSTKYTCAKDEDAALIAALRNSAEELIRDARRLAYLERMFRAMSLNIDGNHVWTFTNIPTLRGQNLRAALDTAIAQERKE